MCDSTSHGLQTQWPSTEQSQIKKTSMTLCSGALVIIKITHVLKIQSEEHSDYETPVLHLWVQQIVSLPLWHDV